MERDTTVQLTLLVDASPAAIWRSLTDPHLTKLYMEGWQVRSTLKVGSPILWVEQIEGMEYVRAQGTVMACIPDRRLRYTRLVLDGKLPDEPASYTTVDVTLEQEEPQRTRVELWHGDFAGLPHDVRRARATGRAWVESLVGLKRITEEQFERLAAA